MRQRLIIGKYVKIDTNVVIDDSVTEHDKQNSVSPLDAPVVVKDTMEDTVGDGEDDTEESNRVIGEDTYNDDSMMCGDESIDTTEEMESETSITVQQEKIQVVPNNIKTEPIEDALSTEEKAMKYDQLKLEMDQLHKQMEEMKRRLDNKNNPCNVIIKQEPVIPGHVSVSPPIQSSVTIKQEPSLRGAAPHLTPRIVPGPASGPVYLPPGTRPVSTVPGPGTSLHAPGQVYLPPGARPGVPLNVVPVTVKQEPVSHIAPVPSSTANVTPLPQYQWQQHQYPQYYQPYQPYLMPYQPYQMRPQTVLYHQQPQQQYQLYVQQPPTFAPASASVKIEPRIKSEKI